MYGRLGKGRVWEGGSKGFWRGKGEVRDKYGMGKGCLRDFKGFYKV